MTKTSGKKYWILVLLIQQKPNFLIFFVNIFKCMSTVLAVGEVRKKEWMNDMINMENINLYVWNVSWWIKTLNCCILCLIFCLVSLLSVYTSSSMDEYLFRSAVVRKYKEARSSPLIWFIKHSTFIFMYRWQVTWTILQ